MRNFLFIFLLVALAQIPSDANAGKLGTCKRCVTDSGIEAHIWTRSNLPGSDLFCQSEGYNDGGDGNTSLCDAQAGVSRWSGTNDPFWRCGINNSQHGAWVGGENDDLVVLSPDKNDINAGTFFRVQDGDGYRCGLDFVSGANFSILKRGRKRDIIDLWVHDGNGGFRQETDRLQDGEFHALIAGQNYAAVLYGNHKDILRIYGIRSDGTVVEKAKFINDGRNHTLHKLSDTDFGITYGNNDDIRVRFCFTGQKWQTGYIGIDHPYKDRCDTDLNW